MDAVNIDSKPIWQTLWFRSLGFLPLIFFIARLIAYVQIDQLSQMLWMCHLSNLFLAAGLFLANPLLIRVAVVLLVWGIPPWIVDMFVIRTVTPVSVVSHLGGMVVGLLALEKIRVKSRTWVFALGLFVLVQILSHFASPPELNVNTSHRVYDIFTDIVSSYWLYWVMSTAVIGVSLWVIEFALLKMFPLNRQCEELLLETFE